MDIEDLLADCNACNLKDNCGPVDLEEESPVEGELAADSKVSRILKDIEHITASEIVYLLECPEDEWAHVVAAANDETRKHFGNNVFFRGIIEFSNMCSKDCNYCGVRKSNKRVDRFRMSYEDIIDCARWLHGAGYGSVVLQSGECDTREFIDFVLKCVHGIRKECGEDLSIVLSVGEFDKKIYQEFFDAGANRYLLRIESSSPRLYASLHPDDGDHLWARRRQCLTDLREVGFQVGSGVMIGLPGQNHNNLAEDILFFKRFDVDMIGMGPFIMHTDTPMFDENMPKDEVETKNQKAFDITLRMNAIARLVLKDINIAATTALQAIQSKGREKACLVGANVIMPNVTPTQLRSLYKLYDGKPCLKDDREDCLNCLKRRLKSVGKKVVLGKPFDPPHYYSRRGLKPPSL